MGLPSLDRSTDGRIAGIGERRHGEANLRRNTVDRRTAGGETGLRLVAALLIVGAAGAASIALGPDDNWDLLYYHLYAPFAYLHHRYLYDIGPAQSQGFYNPMADLLFYGMISSRLNEFPRIVALVMGAVHGINAVLVVTIARECLGPHQATERRVLRTIAALIGVTGAGFVSLIGTTTNDLINSIFVLGALLAVLRVARPDGGIRGFAVAGLLMGLGVGLKYTAAVFVPGLTLAALIVAARRRAMAGPVAFALAAVVGCLAVAGHHMLTLWRDFGNPLFPLLNDIFQSPYWEPRPLRDMRFVPPDLWQAIANPFRWMTTNQYLTTEEPFRDWRGAVASLAIAAALVHRFRSSHHIAAPSHANFGIKRCTSKFMIPVRFLNLKFLHRGCRTTDRNFKFTALVMRIAVPGRRTDRTAETPGLGLVMVFVVASFLAWQFAFGIYRYAVVIEMLSGIVVVGALLRVVAQPRLRLGIAAVLALVIAATTVHPDWGRGEWGDRAVDVRVPALPAHSTVLIATEDPAAYFIPFAEPTTRFLGIENNYLTLSQANRLASEVKRLMRTPGPRFILSLGPFDPDKLGRVLDRLGLRLGPLPCLPIESNLVKDDGEQLSLCPVAD